MTLYAREFFLFFVLSQLIAFADLTFSNQQRRNYKNPLFSYAEKKEESKCPTSQKKKKNWNEE